MLEVASGKQIDAFEKCQLAHLEFTYIINYCFNLIPLTPE